VYSPEGFADGPFDFLQSLGHVTEEIESYDRGVVDEYQSTILKLDPQFG
jgi:hypothetical protein